MVERIVASVELPPEPRPSINYILGRLANDQYQSKSQRMRMLHAATVGAARVNTIHTLDNNIAIQSIDDPISFPLINPSRVITPHFDVLVLTLCINDFDVHRVLIDPGSAANLLQLPPLGK